MARKVFFSFHYAPDNWRASQVRKMGVLEGNSPCTDNDWESVTKGGDAAIKKWIDSQLSGRSCAVILVGSGTAGRKWINYEIDKAWNDGKGVVAVNIHGLKNSKGEQANKGSNPLLYSSVKVGVFSTPLAQIAKIYDTPYSSSNYVYDHIKSNLSTWIEEAVSIRNKY
ncbi:MAG: TIR domain-containing protein [Fimbriimonadaceae bacterium]|nr:TIR domain-containing protein [Fimbriimonadaceae bacterium]